MSPDPRTLIMNEGPKGSRSLAMQKNVLDSPWHSTPVPNRDRG